MALKEIDNFRTKYPQYNDVNDMDLAKMLGDKYPESYKDLVTKVSEESSKKPDENTQGQGRTFVGEAVETLKSIGKVYPMAESVANIVTSTYGAPLSGLAGLFALPFGIDDARKVVEQVQKYLIYQPQTEGGKQLLGTATLPLEIPDKIGGYIGGEIEETGHPNIAAAVHSAISSLPVLVGAKMALRKPTSTGIKIDKQTSSAIKTGMNKSIRPSVANKGTNSRVNKYYKQATSAIEEIIKNKENLNLIDDKGAKIKGLPKTLDQFTQAIEQTKRNIFEEYDSLAKQSDKYRSTRDLKYPLKEGERPVVKKGEYSYIEKPAIKIDLDRTAKKLRPVIKNKILQDLSPETISYAETRIKSLNDRKSYTAVETQEAIQFLNQTLDKFYRDPSPAMKGQAYIDALIANDLRLQLDNIIQKTTGKEYTNLKKKYGDLKAIEKDVTHRSIVDARKNNKGLIDFSDIFSSHQVIKGMLAKEPATLAGGLAVKGVSKYYKMLNDPNRIVKNMFGDVEKLIIEKRGLDIKKRPPIGKIAYLIDETIKKEE